MNYITNILFNLIFILLTDESETRNSLKSSHWWSVALEYENPYSYLETNEISPDVVQKYYSESNPGLQHLSKSQRKLVLKNPGSFDSVARGAWLAIKECQHQFENRRWNCPVKESDTSNSVFGKILDIGCRETAFIYSIASAGIAHSVAWDCSRGRIQTCSCDYKHDEPAGKDWNWGGCSDNVRYGYRFSRRLVDSVEKGDDLRFMVNRQNNEAGRKHVLTETSQKCKCHGMSGSCAMKTCWMRLPEFRVIGEKLKERFDGASKVYADNDWGSNSNDNRIINQKSNKKAESKKNNNIQSDDSKSSGRKRSQRIKNKKRRKYSYNFLPVDVSHKKPTRKDMVYFEDSPNFCVLDGISRITEGTTGRQCNATSMGIDGCDLLCCGRGYRTEQYQVRERCSCIFKWCCDVECQVCVETRTRHICN